MNGRIEITRISKRSKDKLRGMSNSISNTHRLPLIRALDLVIDNTPIVLNTEIVRLPKTKRKKLIVDYRQEFYFK